MSFTCQQVGRKCGNPLEYKLPEYLYRTIATRFAFSISDSAIFTTISFANQFRIAEKDTQYTVGNNQLSISVVQSK